MYVIYMPNILSVYDLEVLIVICDILHGSEESIQH